MCYPSLSWKEIRMHLWAKYPTRKLNAMYLVWILYEVRYPFEVEFYLSMFCLPNLVVHIIHALILFFMICGIISRSKKPHMNGQLMQNCFILDGIGISPTTNSHYVCVFISDQKWSTNNAWPGFYTSFAFI